METFSVHKNLNSSYYPGVCTHWVFMFWSLDADDVGNKDRTYGEVKD